MPFIGNQPALSYTSFAKQDFTTSATTSYTLDNPVANANELALFINFVRQEPTTAYSASGTSLTLTSATSATDDMYCVFLGKAVQTVNPPNASVGTSQLVDGAVTSAKLSAGKVLQVIQATTGTEVAVTGTTFTDTTLTASITPISTSNKILVSVNQSYHVNKAGASYAFGGVRLLRDTTSIWNPNPEDASGSYGIGVQIVGQAGTYTSVGFVNYNYLDSPSTTSATTYKTQIRAYTASGIATAQRAAGINNGESSIILMEISG